MSFYQLFNSFGDFRTKMYFFLHSSLRLLDFRRAVPVAGRILNIPEEIYRFADETLRKTFFISRANNICFYGQCLEYCDSKHAICGKSDKIEGSLVAFMPSSEKAQRRVYFLLMELIYFKTNFAVVQISLESVEPYPKNEELGG